MASTKLTAIIALGLMLVPAIAAGLPGGSNSQGRGPPQAVGKGFTPPVGGEAEEPGAGAWTTFFLDAPDDVFVPPPGSLSSTLRELKDLERLRTTRTAEDMAAARAFDDGQPNRIWVKEHAAALERHQPGPPLGARHLAIVDTAVYDALVAAWHWKYTYNRAGPGQLDPTLPAFAPRVNPSYPSEHAVAAGAAAAVLAWLYPDDAWRFDDLAKDVAHSRVAAGVNFPSDVEAGLALGRAVAAIVIDARENDGAAAGGAPHPGPLPMGPCQWSPTPIGFEGPLAVGWGAVDTFLPDSRAAFNVPPPPVCNSPEYVAEHRHVFDLSANLTPELVEWAEWWHDHDGLAVAGIFAPLTMDYVLARDLSTPRAARVFAVMHASMADAFIGAWKAKYTYWTERPVHVIRDRWVPDWLPLIETPPFPGYPSGHSAQGGSSEELLGHFFPERAILATRWGYDEARSREYGGVHPVFDDEAGRDLGKSVAQVYMDWEMQDGLVWDYAGPVP